MKKKLILLSIILIGLLLRILFINTSPPSFYGDELTILLDANSLLHSGHDQLGNFMPLTFSMGAGRPAGYVYFSIPFVALLGNNALGVRGLSIISGVGLILLLYLITKKIFSEKVGLITAGLYAISPWDISLSRGGFEAHFALFLALTGVYLFLEADKKPLLYIISAISFGLTLHTYPTYKLSLILFLPLLLLFTNRKAILEKGRKYFFIALSVFLLLAVLSLSQTFLSGSETRFSSINIFSQVKLKNTIEQKINLERSSTRLLSIFPKFFHNKTVEYIKIFSENYLQNFSTDFLIIHGDRNPRHNMATMGEIFFVESFLMLIGLLSFWYKQKRLILFLLFWITLAPIPTAFVDLPHALRSSFMLPPLIILSSLGLYTLIKQKRRVFLLFVGTFYVIQMTFFIQKLYFLAPYEYSPFWSYPAKLATETVLENKKKYEYIFLSDRIDSMEFAYPIYAKIAASEVVAQNKNKVILDKYAFKKFDNVYIGPIPYNDLDNFLNNFKGKTMYIGDISDLKYFKSYETLRGIYDTDTLVLIRR